MDNLNLNIDWDLGEDKVKAGMAENRRVIEGVGETVDQIQARVEKQINESIANTEKQAVAAKTQLEQLQRTLTAWEDDLQRKVSATGLSIDDSQFDHARRTISMLREEIARLQEPLPNTIIDESKQKLIDLQDQIDKLKNAGKKGFDEVGESVKKNSGFMTMLARIIPGVGLAGLFSSALKPLAEMVLNMDIFKKKLTDAQKEAKLLSDALAGSEYKRAIVSIEELRINLDLAKKGLYDKKAAINEYNESIGLVTGKISTLKEAETGLADNAESYVKMTLYKAAANLALEEAASEALEIEKLRLLGIENSMGPLRKQWESFLTMLYNPNTRTGGELEAEHEKRMGNLTSIEIAKKEKAEKAKLAIAERFQLRTAEIAKSMGGVLGFDQKADDKDTKEMERSVAAAQAMQQKIYDLKAEYTRKAKGKDEEELQAVRDKFTKIEEEAERFNKDKKNKVKVSVEGLDEIRDAAIADLEYKQETEKLKISLSEQKELYRDYEDFKTSLGKEKADEKYRDLIDIEKTHLQNLRAELAKVPTDDPSGSQIARKEELEKQIREEESLQLKKFNDLLKANQSYESKVKIAIENFEAEKEKLIEKGALEEVETLTTNHRRNLESLNEAHVKQLDAYKKLFDGIELLSNVQAKNVIENAKAMLANTDMPEALYLKILSLIRESEKALNDRIYHRVGQIGQAFDEMAAGIGEMNEGLSTSLGILGDMLHAVSTVGTSIGDIKTGITDYAANKANAGGGALGTISGVAAIAGPIGQAVGAVANLAKGIVNVFRAAKESRIQAERELAAFDEQKYSAEFEINAMYRDRLRTQNEINKSSIDGLKEYRALLKEQQKEVDGDAERLLKALQGEEYVTGKKTEKYGGFLGIGKKTRTVDIMGSLARKSFEDIEKLFVSNQLTDRAKELFLQLEKLKKEGVDVDKMLADNTASLWEKSTGTTVDALTDVIVQGFKNGYRAPEDFADHFRSEMNKSAEQFFRDFISNKEMAAFYEKYAGMASEGVLTEAQRAELKTIYNGMLGRISDKYEDMKDILGDDFLADPNKKSKGMSGSIQSITQNQADSLGGQVGGIHMAVVQAGEIRKEHLVTSQEQLEVLREGIMVQIQIEENTRLTATNTNRLEKIENTLVSMDKKMTNDASLRGAGR